MESETKELLELIATVYNINDGYNTELLRHSEAIKNYSMFIAQIKSGIRSGLSVSESIKNAIKQCIADGVMKDYLLEHGSEVFGMIYEEWDWDVALRVEREEGVQQGIQQGVEQGIQQGQNDLSQALKKLGVTPDIIEQAKALAQEDNKH